MAKTVAADIRALLNLPGQPSFPLAFVIAPFAGAFVAGALGTLLAAPWRLGIGPWSSPNMTSLPERVSGTVGIGFFTTCFAFFIAAGYTVILGGRAVVRYRRTGETAPLPKILVRGLMAGVLPFACFPLLLGIPTEFTTHGGPGAVSAVVFFLAVATAASLATAWTFWRLGLKGRTVPSEN